MSAGAVATILHVEDEELNRALLRAVLKRAPDDHIRSAALLEAPTLEAARGFLAGDAINLVLLDVRLPDGNGLDLVGEIRARRPDLGVVVMSASVLPEERELALRSGCDAFISKPYAAADLLETLRRLLPTDPTDA